MTNKNGAMPPQPIAVEVPEAPVPLTQKELVEWWHTTDAPGDIKDAVSVLLRHHVMGAQAVELLYRNSQHPSAAVLPLPLLPPKAPKTVLYVRCRPRKGAKAESAAEVMRAVLTGQEVVEIPSAVYVDDLGVADALVEHFDVIIEGSK
jgi:hypothetical protein